MASSRLSPEELDIVVAVERTSSIFSLLGCVFIILTFSLSKAFHKPVNRLVFYASFGNMISNVGTLMAREFTGNIDSFGCQFQAFLIQMFMPADALWSMAMAVNVYLTFYCKFDAQMLHSMEKWYFLLCYGIPFIPAISFIFVRSTEQGRMYDDAILWCWVSHEREVWRIATFYAPVWVIIAVTVFVYIRCGGEIYKRREQVQKFDSSSQDPDAPAADDPLAIKTTEVMVTSETAGRDHNLEPHGRHIFARSPKKQQHDAAYSVTISSNLRRSQDPSLHDSDAPASRNEQSQPASLSRQWRMQRRRANFEANNAVWSYTKCAILFFTAILITWLPSTANRLYGVVYTLEVSFPLEVMSAIVLPLQGFWNAIIYVYISWQACKSLLAGLIRPITRAEGRPRQRHSENKRIPAIKLQSRRSSGNFGSGSMTESALTSPTPPGSSKDHKEVYVAI